MLILNMSSAREFGEIKKWKRGRGQDIRKKRWGREKKVSLKKKSILTLTSLLGNSTNFPAGEGEE